MAIDEKELVAFLKTRYREAKLEYDKVVSEVHKTSLDHVRQVHLDRRICLIEHIGMICGLTFEELRGTIDDE